MAGRGSDVRSEAAGARTVAAVGRQRVLSWMDELSAKPWTCCC
jgi:hypothetical protein